MESDGGTVSEPDLTAVAMVVPVVFLAKTKKPSTSPREVVDLEERPCALNARHWQNETTTDGLRGSLESLRLNRKHSETNYFPTEPLSDHRGFQSNLHKIGKVSFPDCIFRNGVVDDADHTFFSVR